MQDTAPLPHPTAPRPDLLVPCPDCDGRGELETYTYMGRAGWEHPHASPYDTEPCTHCVDGYIDLDEAVDRGLVS